MLSALNFNKNNIGFNLTYNFIGKDVIGQLGGLGISYLRRNKIDKNPSKQGKISVGLQQLSVLMELCLNYFPVNFIAIAGAQIFLKI